MTWIPSMQTPDHLIGNRVRTFTVDCRFFYSCGAFFILLLMSLKPFFVFIVNIENRETLKQRLGYNNALPFIYQDSFLKSVCKGISCDDNNLK